MQAQLSNAHGAGRLVTRACPQVTIAYVDLALSRPERRAALLGELPL